MTVGNFPLQGKIAVVTGGGSGINLAFVRLALACEAKVLIADIKHSPEAQALTDDPKLADRVDFTHCDVSNWADLDALPAAVTHALGPSAVADVWVADAGVFEPPWSTYHDDPEDSHYRAMRINADHPMKPTRIATRALLRADKPGVVLILASSAGLAGFYASPLAALRRRSQVPFRAETVRVRKVVLVAMDCPDGGAELCAFVEKLSSHDAAALGDGSEDGVGDDGRQAECLVNDCPEVLAGAQLGPDADLIFAREGRADLGDQTLECLWVVKEGEEGGAGDGSNGGGPCVNVDKLFVPVPTASTRFRIDGEYPQVAFDFQERWVT